jgi:hypothetical protein
VFPSSPLVVEPATYTLPLESTATPLASVSTPATPSCFVPVHFGSGTGDGEGCGEDSGAAPPPPPLHDEMIESNPLRSTEMTRGMPYLPNDLFTLVLPPIEPFDTASALGMIRVAKICLIT